MDPRPAATRVPDPDAVEFIRFCYRRRRVGWPELYDEMCAVANRGLYHGLDADDLAAHGIAFGLFDMPGLAAMTRDIVAEEQALRRPVRVAIHADPPSVAPVAVVAAATASPDIADTTFDVAIVTSSAGHETDLRPVREPVPVFDRSGVDRSSPTEVQIRFAPVPAGA